MSRFPLSSKDVVEPFRPLQSNAGFLLDIEGHKVIALRLPSEVAREISGQEQLTSRGILARLKARLRLGIDPETERWLTFTSVDNPLLEEYDKFRALVAQELTTAIGTTVTKADLAVSAGVPITGMERPRDNVEGEVAPSEPTSSETNH